MYPIVLQLSEKIKTEATIWRIIAVVQFLIGIVTVIVNLADENFEEILYGGLIIFVGVRNFKISCDDFNYAQEILNRPIGIVGKFESIIPLIIDLAYNVFIGGVVGVVACVFSFLTRNFVIKNKQGFLAIENGFNGINIPFDANINNFQNQ